MSALDHFPPADEAGNLLVDELGIRLLRYILDVHGSGLGNLSSYNLLLPGGELADWWKDARGRGGPTPL
ncbi:MAG TPA: hypothetical protein VFP13_03105 [Actinomycetota bacterium]|nr:hypothetical protein [Actinomycetota bacterium]